MTPEVLTGERARLDPGDLIGPRPAGSLRSESQRLASHLRRACHQVIALPALAWQVLARSLGKYLVVT